MGKRGQRTAHPIPPFVTLRCLLFKKTEERRIAQEQTEETEEHRAAFLPNMRAHHRERSMRSAMLANVQHNLTSKIIQTRQPRPHRRLLRGRVRNYGVVMGG